MRTHQILTVALAFLACLMLAAGATAQAGTQGTPAAEGPSALWDRFPLDPTPPPPPPLEVQVEAAPAQEGGEALMLGAGAGGAALVLAALAVVVHRRRAAGVRPGARAPTALTRFLSEHEPEIVGAALGLAGTAGVAGLLVLVVAAY